MCPPERDPTARTTRTYDRIAPSYLARWRERRGQLPELERFAEMLPARARVLDLGCGPGFDAAWLCQRGFQAFGLDRSLGMLQSGRADYAVPLVQADMRHLPLPSASLEGIWANASLHHLSPAELPEVLTELGRVLVGTGRGYLSLKRGQGEAWEPAPYGEGGPRFYAYWEPEALDRQLEAAGFEILARDDDPPDGQAQPWLVRLVKPAAPA